MMHRVRDRLKFRLERWIQRGVFHQLLLTAALVGAVAVVAGTIVGGLSGAFDHWGEAVWWAFLRLTDPGYLGDDEGTLLRTTSTLVTVLGYVLFMGSLIAILTQWLNGTLRTLERGLTPISIEDHLLILGWTNRTPALVRELMLSEGRVRRFLRRHGARSLRIVILAERVDAAFVVELRELLGPAWNERQLILRSGSPLRIEHLRRVDYARAAVIILPGGDFAMGGAEAADARIIKTLLTVSSHDEADELPAVVAEIFDTDKVSIARQAYGGAVDLVASDALISRLIAQNVRHPGLSYVYAELLSHTFGNEVYVRSWPALAGTPLRALAGAFPKAVLLGAVRPEGQGFAPLLNPPEDARLEAADRLVFVARDYADAEPARGWGADGASEEVVATARPPVSPQRRLLVLGWSHKVPALLRELGSYTGESFQVDVLSVVPAAEREQRTARLDLPGEAVQVRQFEGDYTASADLERFHPERYQNVVFLGSDWLDSGEASDARTILGYVLLRSMLARLSAPHPAVLVELMDPENARLFKERAGEVIISPVILSHMLAHVALRRELVSVFEELFGPGGAEILFRPAADYGLAGRTVGFREVQAEARRHGETALGIRPAAEAATPGGGVRLNPGPAARWRLEAEDEIVVMTTY